MTDQSLVEAAKAGDADAIDTLIRRYQVRMFNYSKTLAASDRDAEDMTQETFVRAFRALRRFRGESSFKNWLSRSRRTSREPILRGAPDRP